MKTFYSTILLVTLTLASQLPNEASCFNSNFCESSCCHASTCQPEAVCDDVSNALKEKISRSISDLMNNHKMTVQDLEILN